MASAELLLLSLLRAFIEVAGLFLLGQGALHVLAGSRREHNAIYRLMRLLTGPVLRGMRRLAPKMIIDRHLPVFTFFVLFWLWIALAYLRQSVCEANRLVCG